jgi:hypothetical protein
MSHYASPLPDQPFAGDFHFRLTGAGITVSIQTIDAIKRVSLFFKSSEFIP